MSNSVWSVIVVTLTAYNFLIYYEFLSRPVVRTNHGWVRGVQSPNGYYMFLGIPYARVDEQNPFGKSLPVPRFSETFDASDDTKICPQVEEILQYSVGTLQCLSLNIYVPKKMKKYPVIVFIHGGEYRFGHSGRAGKLSVYEPDKIVTQDVILVKFNYRLGMYGFQCLDTPDVPGNQGLRDQTSALRWVKENIVEFGGDPDKITILGHSSGAMSVDFHAHVNFDLFDQVIIQSGSAMIPGGVGKSNRSLPFEVAAKLGHAAKDLDDALEFLKNRDVYDVVEATTEVTFRPCIEREFLGVETFLKQHPMDIKPDLRNKKVIIGNALHEYVVDVCPDDIFVNNDEKFKDNINLDFEISDDNIINEAKHFYIGDNVMSEKFVNQGLQFVNDLLFNYPTHRVIDKYLDSGVNKIYYYIFDYSGDRNLMKIMKNVVNKYSVVHADEMGYLFNFSFFDKHVTEDDTVMIERMTLMWTNFAKFGEPIPEETELLPIKWDPVTTDNKRHFMIGKELKMDDTLLTARMKFWNDFYRKYEGFLKYKNGSSK